MFSRLSRGAVALALIAGATITVTLLEASSASAIGVPFSLQTGGSTGTVFIDAHWGTDANLCGGISPDGNVSGYDGAWDWNAGGGLFTRAPWTQPPTNVPTDGPGCSSSLNLSNVRLELYPSLNTYDPWTGNFGGANSQLTYLDPQFPNFGSVPVPTLGVAPAGYPYPAFRMTGSIISSMSIPNNRVITDLFQMPCGYPDVCVQPPQSSTGAYVGGFATGKSKASQWTGSIAWPGRYQVYVKDCPTGWSASNTCTGPSRQVMGFVDISDGNVPTWDLDAPCFGILNCQYLAGGPTTPTGGFHPLSPTRLLDTRFNNGITGAIRSGDGRLTRDPNPVNRIAEMKNHEIKVTGIAGIPSSGVSAVLLNVTAVSPPGSDWLSVYPRPASFDIYNNQGTYGANPPTGTSNLNFTPGETVANLVLAPVGAGGTIRFWNANPAGMHVIADVAGWFDTGASLTSSGGLRFTGITPARLLDTRTLGDTIPRFNPGDDRELLVAGVGNVPSNAQSVVVNITSVSPTKIGYVTTYPDGTTRPNASNVNLNPGITRSNLAVVKVGANGKIRVAAFESDMDLIVDVMGYYGGTGGGLTTAISPVRVVDTRDGTGTPAGRFGPCETRSVKVAGVAGIPADITGIVLNVTAADTDNGGYLTVWPAGVAKPPSSNLNWDPFRNTPNMVIVGVSRSGHISIFNECGGNATVIVDVFAYVK